MRNSEVVKVYGVAGVLSQLNNAVNEAIENKMRELREKARIEKIGQRLLCRAEDDLLMKVFPLGKTRVRFSDFMLLEMAAWDLQAGNCIGHDTELECGITFSGFVFKRRSYIFVAKTSKFPRDVINCGGTVADYLQIWRDIDFWGTLLVVKGNAYDEKDDTPTALQVVKERVLKNNRPSKPEYTDEIAKRLNWQYCSEIQQ